VTAVSQPEVLPKNNVPIERYAVFLAHGTDDSFRIRLDSDDWKVANDTILANLPVRAPQLLLLNREQESEVWIRTYADVDMIVEVRVIRLRSSYETDGCKTSFLEYPRAGGFVAFSYECVGKADKNSLGGQRGMIVGIRLRGKKSHVSIVADYRLPLWDARKVNADGLARSIEYVP
jgi:hypothetical protein